MNKALFSTLGVIISIALVACNESVDLQSDAVVELESEAQKSELYHGR